MRGERGQRKKEKDKHNYRQSRAPLPTNLQFAFLFKSSELCGSDSVADYVAELMLFSSGNLQWGYSNRFWAKPGGDSSSARIATLANAVRFLSLSFLLNFFWFL
jgi:hypothetical protein